jgi:hypothetical protein
MAGNIEQFGDLIRTLQAQAPHGEEDDEGMEAEEIEGGEEDEHVGAEYPDEGDEEGMLSSLLIIISPFRNLVLRHELLLMQYRR